MSDSLYHRIRSRFWWHWVDPNDLLVVRRFGRSLDFRGPGEVWVNPLVEDVLGKIYVGFRFVDVDVPLHSVDGHTVTYAIRVGFTYHPRHAVPAQQAPFAMKVLETPDLFVHMMDLMAGGVLRELAAVQTGRKLINGQNAVDLAHRVEERLSSELSSLGVRLGLPRAIQVRSVRAPRSLREATEWVGFANVLSDDLRVSPERVAAYMMTLKLYEQLAAGQGVYILPGATGLDALSPQLLQLMPGLVATHRGPTQGHS
ncbi:MAG: hypothetical protein DCC55_26785 [Chloroflexi bacterium]|nr:MAG: hypothetical protein DCC55_26785 [Chloroflexota bacterium]